MAQQGQGKADIFKKIIVTGSTSDGSTNLIEYRNSENTLVHYIDTLGQSNVNNISKEPTGFTDPSAVIVSFANKRITLTGTVEAYWKGRRVTELVSGWTCPTDAPGGVNSFLYYDGTNFVWGSAVWTFDMLQIAFISKDGYAIRECHGLMPWQVHKELHETTGTYKSSGGDFPSNTYTLNSTTVTNRRPTISSASINDEDILTIISPMSSSYTQMYLSGSTGVAKYNLNSLDIVPSASSILPYYNQFTTTWIQTAFPNNAYGAIFVMAVPVAADANSQQFRYQFIQPQTTSTTLATIQALGPESLSFGDISMLIPEYSFVGKIIIRMATSNWTLISVEKLTGRNNTVSVQGGYISAVNTNGTLIGNGTANSPLGVSGSYLTSVSADYHFAGNGTAVNPLSLAYNYMTTVATDGVTITGDGVVYPLSLIYGYLTSIAVDNTTIVGNGTPSDPIRTAVNYIGWAEYVPTSNVFPGLPGQMAYDSSGDYLYICYSTDMWSRIKLDNSAW